MIRLILFLVIALPVAWFASEFQSKRWIRLTFGFAAIMMAFGVAYGVSSLERLNSNAWFGEATKSLIDATINKLDAGDTSEVVNELKWLQSQYEPTYENRARYDYLVEEYVSRLSNTSR